MRKLWCLLLVILSTEAFSKSLEWFALDSKILLNKEATLYGNKKSNAQVLHKVTPVKAIFSNSKKETSHHCRILGRILKGSMKMLKRNGVDYCLITPSNSVVMAKKDGLHHYQFTNATSEEIDSFLDNQGLKK